MNQPNAGQPGLPQHHPLHYTRPGGLIQQRRPDSPYQPPNPLQSTQQGPYLSPHSSTQSLPPQQHPSPYVGSVQALPQHQQGESTFFGAHPSPYSTGSATGSYASSEPSESMATQAAMGRQPYPPMQSYQTPQSNSPASMHSPQTDAHGRPLYAVHSMPQQMYYQHQYQMQQPSYAQHHPPPPPQQPSITSAPGPMMAYQQAQQPMQPQQHHSNHQQPMIDTKPSTTSLQRPPSVIAPPHGTPQTPNSAAQGPPTSASSANPSAAPGPIPATTPLVVRQDNNGVQWIAFEYSRDRVKMEYTIRCDVEAVNTEELSQEFKSANCVYPRACVNKDQYKGNRLHYESECNAVGWALAQLNPCLREKRGLIQRAVDSWRNSNQDVRLRSRRVRRQAKMTTRKGGPPMTPGPAGQVQGSQGSAAAGLSNAQVGVEPGSTPAHHHQAPSNRQGSDTTPASATPRYGQNFYPTYPHQASVGSVPSIHDNMDPMHPHASALAAPAVKQEDETSRKRALFGDVPESKRRKFILVEDSQRGTRVRVRVTLDQVKMDDMPDAHLKINAVYPRSYYSRQIGSPPASPRWNDEDDEVEGESGTLPTRGKTVVPVSLMDGSEAKMPLPRMTKSRRNKEIALNELGYRMSWGQARTFNGRTLFLQRSLDAYRNKMRSTITAAGQDISASVPHFETRPGKRKWADRNKRSRRADSPQT